MDEATARTKYCPHLTPDIAREDLDNGTIMSVVAVPHCIASHCMMWEWVRVPEDMPFDEQTKRWAGMVDSTTEGDCGLKRRKA